MVIRNKTNIASDIIGITNRVLNISKNNAPSPVSYINQNININNVDKNTDIWIKNCLSTKIKHAKNDSITLLIPKVLQKLQHLRTSDHNDSYFRLLAKLKATDINWVTRNNNSIGTSVYLPIEFYNELSIMLKKLASKDVDYTTKMALAKYSLKMIKTYNTIISDRCISNNYRFYRDCITCICNTESVLLLHETIRYFKEKNLPEFLTHYANLTFYHKTSEITKLLEYLEFYIYHEKFKITADQRDLLEPIFLNVIKKLTLLNAEEESIILLKYMKKWSININDHDKSVLLDLCEKKGSFKLKKEIVSFDSMDNSQNLIIDWKILQSSDSVEKIMIDLNNRNINPFNSAGEYTFLQLCFNDRDQNIEFWNQYITRNIVASTLSTPLKVLYLQSLLSYLVSSGMKFQDVLSILNYLSVDLRSNELFLLTTNLKGMEKSTSFNILFKLLERRPSAKLTSQTLLGFLEKYHNELNYTISCSNYISLFKTALSNNDTETIYYFLLKYLILEGDTLYLNDAEKSWKLPDEIEMFFRSNEIPKEAIKFLDKIHLYANNSKKENEFSEATVLGEFGNKGIYPLTEENIRSNNYRSIMMNEDNELYFSSYHSYYYTDDKKLDTKLKSFLSNLTPLQSKL
ncbi:hypothetical protein TPHA_0H02880 [Tetrapisispora phaffii CBS 4417]|uniref:Uncharacterized protein n=1 Tax=Tetrapisispora phaffii (strain ATCC 24235 / CBS 4417 / NBRC 1672 / NRRL Y-8282 / UCD 70-5) TaxID=1071381 RepID=G8BWP0_TETPH|nr:hypothetical protein TPHA_0H02880 [Tetrapisispora phaffii CBS 4417]CCE64491.1 hypothetical protein TPHA_0H02880 [Tetrapisispora phaffii CBS 4417]